MNLVRLNRRLVLEAAQNQVDGAGGFSQVWVGLGVLWAEVAAGTGREITGQEVLVSATPYRITVRGAAYGSAARPKPDQRFRDGERLFTILSVAERDPDARYLICIAREEVPA